MADPPQLEPLSTPRSLAECRKAEIFIKVRKRICVYSADYTGLEGMGE